MERTTSGSSAAGGMSSAIVKQGDGSNIFQQRAHSVNPFSISPQVPWWSRAGDAPLTSPHQNPVERPYQRGHAQRLLSPPSFFPPPGGLISALGFGSGSVAAVDNSLSGHGPTETSYFPTLSTLDLQVPAATPLPAALGGRQPWQRIVLTSDGLISASGFGSGSMTVGNNSLSIHGHTATPQSLPSSSFPTINTTDLQVSADTPFPTALGGQLWQGMVPLSSSGLISAPGFGSGSAAVGDNSPSIYRHAATSQSLLSSFFPTLNTVDLQVPAATPFPVALGGQPWQGLAPPAWTTLGLPTCPSQGAFSGFAAESAALGQTAAWQQSEMPFILPASISSQPLPSSSDNCVGFTQPSSSNYELPPLPPSLRIPPLEEESTYSMLSTLNGTIPWHYGESSMGVGNSIPAVPNLAAGAMKAPMPPPRAPSLSQGVGAGSSNFIGFEAQPSLSSELAALRAGLQAHLLLPVKQEPTSNVEDKLDQDAIQHSMPENSTARGLVGREASLTIPVEISSNASSAKVAGSTPCLNSNSTSKPPLPLPPSLLRAGASSSRSHTTGIIFTDAEKETVRKDKKLQDLVNTDPKRAKRMLSNRTSATKRKATKDIQILEMECKVETLERKRKTSSAELQLAQGQRAELETQHKEMRMTMQEMEQQAMLKDAVNERLQAQIKALMNRPIKLNEMQMSSQKKGTTWFPSTK
ncbi:unnamed protein product [Urochloa decumbens]|uniref:BZIP domain-containing protein n=1 Tax=Urochloa decumbens TaxID=240449 RepID=A0ABC9BKT1_9POAL